MHRCHIRLTGVLAALLLTACGGGASELAGQGSAGVPAHGRLLQNPPKLLSLELAPSLLTNLGALPTQALAIIAAAPVCDVAVYQLEYTTLGGAQEPTRASGALMIPLGLTSKCYGPRPILLYAHGTSTDISYNIADLQVQQNAEGIVLAAFFASQGYIVVAPNYAGYDSSTLSYHPFLNAEQQSGEMIDALTAARSALPAFAAPLTSDGGKLFITGYSEGGYVAMAAHRAMQAAGMPVTASAPMSGPYALAAFVDAVFAGRVNDSAPISVTLMINGYQKAYGNIYTSTSDTFEAQYASGIETLLPTASTRAALYAAGKLPMAALFNPTPPAAQFTDITPATTPANLATVFAQGFGAGNLIKNDYRLQYLLDAQVNPDGAWPTSTNGAPAATPGLALRRATVRNDLRGWVPKAPVLLCGGDADPQVFWFNTQIVENNWMALAPSAANFSMLDVDAGISAGEPFAALKTGFAIAKAAVAVDAVAQGATDGGSAAVFAAYHATLLAPFCVAAVESFFAGL
jgi:hypothetical protein